MFSAFVFVYCSQLVSAMTPNPIERVTGYLKLETIGFVIGNMVSFTNVLFVVLEKPFLKKYGFIGLFGGAQILLDNLMVYYPIVYRLMLKGVFVPDMTFICMMFGFGKVPPIEIKNGKNYKRHRALSNIMEISNYSIDEEFVFTNQNSSICPECKCKFFEMADDFEK